MITCDVGTSLELVRPRANDGSDASDLGARADDERMDGRQRLQEKDGGIEIRDKWEVFVEYVSGTSWSREHGSCCITRPQPPSNNRDSQKRSCLFILSFAVPVSPGEPAHRQLAV